MAWKKILTATEGSPYGSSAAKEHIAPFDITNGVVNVDYTAGEVTNSYELSFFKTSTLADTYGKVLKYYDGRCVYNAGALTGIIAADQYQDEVTCGLLGSSFAWMEAGLYWGPDMNDIYIHPGETDGVPYPFAATVITTVPGYCSSGAHPTRYACEQANLVWNPTNLEPFVQYSAINGADSNKKLGQFKKTHATNNMGHTTTTHTFSHSLATFSLYNLEMGYSGSVPGGSAWTKTDKLTSEIFALDANRYLHNADSTNPKDEGLLSTSLPLADMGPAEVVDTITANLNTDAKGHVTAWTTPTMGKRTLDINDLALNNTDGACSDGSSPNSDACYAAGGTWTNTAGTAWASNMSADTYTKWQAKVGTTTYDMTSGKELQIIIGDGSNLPEPITPLYGEPFLTTAVSENTTTDTINFALTGNYGSGGKIKDIKATGGLLVGWSAAADPNGLINAGAETIFLNPGAYGEAAPVIRVDVPTAALSRTTGNSTSSAHTHAITMNWDAGTGNSTVYDSSTDAGVYGAGTWTPTLLRTRHNSDTGGGANGDLVLYNVAVQNQLIDINSNTSLGTVVQETYTDTADFANADILTFATYSPTTGSIFNQVDSITYGATLLTLDTNYTVDGSTGDITFLTSHTGGDIEVAFAYNLGGETQFLMDTLPINAHVDEEDDPYCMDPTSHAVDAGGTDNWPQYTNQTACEAAFGRWSRFAVLAWSDSSSQIVFAAGDAATNYGTYTAGASRIMNAKSSESFIFQKRDTANNTWDNTRAIKCGNIGTAGKKVPLFANTSNITTASGVVNIKGILEAGDLIIGGTYTGTTDDGKLKYDNVGKELRILAYTAP